MNDMTPQDAQDAAFDARCREVLQGRTATAPEPASTLFADAAPVPSNRRRTWAAAALMVGAVAWGVSHFTSEESPTADPLVTPTEPAIQTPAVETTAVEEASNVQWPAVEEEAMANHPELEVAPTSVESPEETVEAVPVEVASPVIPVDMSETAPVGTAVTPMQEHSAEASSEAANAAIEVVQEVAGPQEMAPVELEEAPSLDADAPVEEAVPAGPTLTLPLTLPADGGQ